MNKNKIGFLLSFFPIVGLAATPINLRHIGSTPPTIYFFSGKNVQPTLKLINKTTDFNKTTHLRFKQYHQGVPVWGGDAIIHTKAAMPLNHLFLNDLAHLQTTTQSKMNGTVYQGLENDLINTPAYVFQKPQLDKSISQAIHTFQQKNAAKIIKQKSQLIVYTGKDKARYAFLVNLLAVDNQHRRIEPTYVLDALTFEIYKDWDNFKTQITEVKAGGLGGNYNKLVMYDYIGEDVKWFTDHFPALNIQRENETGICYMQNSAITVRDGRKEGDPVMEFPCPNKDEKHSLYWNENFDMMNMGFSPSNDVLYNSEITRQLYRNVVGLPLLVTQQGDEMHMDLRVHVGFNYENAGWSDFTTDMEFGDGGEAFYPLTSLGVVAHELSHGFTSQHSQLVYEGQSGGLNESFSDMAAAAAEAYSNQYSDGYNSWQIGQEISKHNRPLRYMDNPRKDCINVPRYLGICSIDNTKDYFDGQNVHFSSGVFNKAFYLISTSPNWNTLKAFQVMVQANVRYWIPHSTFQDAACGVMDAAQDYGYDTKTITKAMKQVGIDTNKC